MSYVHTVSTFEGAYLGGNSAYYYVLVTFTSDIVALNGPVSLTITITDRFNFNYTFTGTLDGSIGYDNDTGKPALVCGFVLDVANYYVSGWTINSPANLVFEDYGSLDGSTSGGIPYNYDLPLSPGQIQMYFAGNLLEIDYAVPYSGGIQPYQLWEFTLYTYPNYDVISSQSQSFDYFEVDRPWLLGNYPGQQIIASAQVIDAGWNYSDTAYSNVLTLPLPGLMSGVMGLGLALGAP